MLAWAGSSENERDKHNWWKIGWNRAGDQHGVRMTRQHQDITSNNNNSSDNSNNNNENTTERVAAQTTVVDAKVKVKIHRRTTSTSSALDVVVFSSLIRRKKEEKISAVSEQGSEKAVSLSESDKAIVFCRLLWRLDQRDCLVVAVVAAFVFIVRFRCLKKIRQVQAVKSVYDTTQRPRYA